MTFFLHNIYWYINYSIFQSWVILQTNEKHILEKISATEYCKSQPKSLYSLHGGRCWSSIPALNHLQAFLVMIFSKGTKELLAPRNLRLWGLLGAELVSTFNRPRGVFSFCQCVQVCFQDPLWTTGTSKEDVLLFNYLLHEDPPPSACFELPGHLLVSLDTL